MSPCSAVNLQGPWKSAKDFNYTCENDIFVINHDMDAADKTIHIVARAILIPKDVTVKAAHLYLEAREGLFCKGTLSSPDCNHAAPRLFVHLGVGNNRITPFPPDALLNKEDDTEKCIKQLKQMLLKIEIRTLEVEQAEND